MIKLTKGKKPQVLIDNAAKWTKEYLDCIQSGQNPSETIAHRYNQPEIKSALERETYGKCAYCESKLKHVEFGDIEHILPKHKNARPDLYVEWDNLTLACEVCNRECKKDYFDPQMPLINPYVDDPDKVFLFVGPVITSSDNNQRAFVTESVLDLNRCDLILQRTERLQSVNRLLHAWSQATIPAIKDTYARELKKECEPDKEYAAFVRHFLTAKGFPKELLT